MTQLVVQFNHTHVLYFESEPTCSAVKQRLEEAEGVPSELLSLSLDGLSLNDEAQLLDEQQPIRATLVSGLCGGKGGFGAQLRALAKQKAYRKTLDFGACRDLSGRRLRHVNDEILLQKWKEAKDKDETLDEQTPTGIDLWFLAAPSWAEGVKVDKRKEFMKPRMKTEMCIDWKRARERRPAPDGAPAHWGCPRGRRCEFAHGVEELRGEAQTALKDAQHQKERDEQHRKRDAYMGVLHRVNKQEEELEDLVLTGLRAAKRAKLAEQGKTDDADTSAVVEALLPEVASEDAAGAEEAEEEQQQTDYLTIVSGTVVVSKASSATISSSAAAAASAVVCPVISSTSAFATVAVDKCALTAGSGRGWYYEVELLSDGLMQVGWGTSAFLAGAGQPASVSAKADAAEAEEGAADGTGDDVNSWAFDGYRQQKWHAGESAAYGPQTGVIWKAGDVVGCHLQLHAVREDSSSAKDSKKRKNSTQVTADPKATISFSVNGVSYGTAFEFSVPPTISGSAEHFFPSISLENEESVELNLGGRSFKFPPGKEYSAVWTSVTGAAVEDSPAVSAGRDGAVESEKVQEAPASVPAPAAPVESVDYTAIDLEAEQYGSVGALGALGLVHLKQELERRGVKAGGTLQERAQRLLAVRRLRPDQIDPKLLAKKK